MIAHQWRVAVLLLGVVVAAGIAVAVPSMTLLSLACASVAVTLTPLVASRRPDWFASWSFIVYATVFGVLVRAILITFDVPTSFLIDLLFLLGKRKEALNDAAWLVFAGLSMLTFGYMAGP